MCASDKVGYQCGFTNVALSLEGLLGPVTEVLDLFCVRPNFQLLGDPWFHVQLVS